MLCSVVIISATYKGNVITNGAPILFSKATSVFQFKYLQLQQSNCSSKQFHFLKIKSTIKRHLNSIASAIFNKAFSAAWLNEIQQMFNIFAINKTVSKIFTKIFENFFSRFQKFAHKGLFEISNTR